MTSTDLDPRFDPRFQRGYDAQRHGPVAQKPAIPDVMAAVPVVAPPAPVEDASAEVDADADPEGFSDEVVRRRNPYFIALIVLPVLLFGVGAYLVVLYIDDLVTRTGTSYWGDYTISTVVPIIAPALIVTGFVALVVVLAQLGLGRGRRG